MTVDLETLESFLRQPTPRDAPRGIRRNALRGGMGMFGFLFGGLFAGLGFVFMVIFFPWRLYPEVMLDLGRGEAFSGTVSEVRETNMRVNERPVRKIAYRFSLADGQTREATCYMTRDVPKPGDEVTVRALPPDYRRSRLDGGHINMSGYTGAFTALFPLVGAGVLMITLAFRSGRLRTLRYGTLVMGRVRSATPTPTHYNNEQVYRLELEATIEGERRTIVHRCHGEPARLALEHQRSDEPVGLLVDPRKPSRVLLAETLLG